MLVLCVVQVTGILNRNTVKVEQFHYYIRCWIMWKAESIGTCNKTWKFTYILFLIFSYFLKTSRFKSNWMQGFFVYSVLVKRQCKLNTSLWRGHWILFTYLVDGNYFGTFAVELLMVLNVYSSVQTIQFQLFV